MDHTELLQRAIDLHYAQCCPCADPSATEEETIRLYIEAYESFCGGGGGPCDADPDDLDREAEEAGVAGRYDDAYSIEIHARDHRDLDKNIEAIAYLFTDSGRATVCQDEEMDDGFVVA